MKMHAGSQTELPAMVFVFRFPLDCEGWVCSSVRTHCGKAIENQVPSEATWALPGIAFYFNAQRAAVVRTGARRSVKGQRGDEAANCNLAESNCNLL